MAEKHYGPLGDSCRCPLKPANAKGKRHSECCFHDEPGMTQCTCGAGEGVRPSADGEG